MNNIPDEFKCPITLDIMKDPIICDDGNTYERRSLLNLTNNLSPITRQPINKNILIPNRALKNLIDKFTYECNSNPHSTLKSLCSNHKLQNNINNNNNNINTNNNNTTDIETTRLNLRHFDYYNNSPYLNPISLNYSDSCTNIFQNCNPIKIFILFLCIFLNFFAILSYIWDCIYKTNTFFIIEWIIVFIILIMLIFIFGYIFSYCLPR